MEITADNIGALGTATQVISGFIGPVDSVDYIEFQLSRPSTINAVISGLSYNTPTTLYLLNVSGNQITSTEGDFYGNGSLIEKLATGTYFLEVSGGNATDYSLSVNATPIIDTAGPTLGTATSISSIGDTVTLSGSHDQYVIADSNGSLYVQDTVSGRDGTQTLSGISQISFADGTGVFDLTGTAENVARIYLATLNRPADPGGLEYLDRRGGQFQRPVERGRKQLHHLAGVHLGLRFAVRRGLRQPALPERAGPPGRCGGCAILGIEPERRRQPRFRGAGLRRKRGIQGQHPGRGRRRQQRRGLPAVSGRAQPRPSTPAASHTGPPSWQAAPHPRRWRRISSIPPSSRPIMAT